MILGERLDGIDCLIISIQKCCVRCGNFDEIIGSNVLNLLPDLLHLEVNYLQVKGDRRRDIEDERTGIV